MSSQAVVEEETVCEINRELLTARGDKAALELYSNSIGFSFPKLTWKADDEIHHAGVDSLPVITVRGEYANEGSSVEQASTLSDGNESRQSEAVDLSSTPRVSRVASSIWEWLDAGLPYLRSFLKRPDRKDQRATPAVSWHWSKQRLALSGSHDYVLVFDLQDAGSEGSPPGALVHEFQRDVSAIEWRPRAGSTLAVACRFGVCLWSFSGAALRAQSANASSRVGGDGPARPWLVPATMSFLQSRHRITSLAWSPCGRLLAAASEDDATIVIWDVSVGICTPLRRGFGGVSLLKWSLTGDYLISAKSGGPFHLWETSTWRSEQWSSRSGSIVSASWSPDGRAVLVAFGGAMTLAAVYFAARPPSLDAHLLPLDLPGVPQALDNEKVGISMMAWDGRGERLVVYYTASDSNKPGTLALYDVRHTPIISTSLVGYIHGPAGSTPLTLEFHANFARGALLAVCWSNGECIIYPMLFRDD